MNKIEINIKKKEDYINKFNKKRISNDLDKYIINEIRTIGLNKKVTVEITTEFNMTQGEKDNLINMIKYSYRDDKKDFIIYEKKSLYIAIILFIIGIIVLSIYYLLRNVLIISEVVLIIGWIIIWEALDELLFARINNKIDQKRRKQLINSKIIFKE